MDLMWKLALRIGRFDFCTPSIPKSNHFPFPFSGLFYCNPDFCSTSNALHVWIWFDVFHLLSTRSSRIINFVGQLFQCLWKSRRWASSMNTTRWKVLPCCTPRNGQLSTSRILLLALGLRRTTGQKVMPTIWLANSIWHVSPMSSLWWIDQHPRKSGGERQKKDRKLMWKGKLIFQRMRNVNGGKMVKTSKKVTGLRNSPGQNRMGPGIKRCNGSNRNPGCKDHGKTRKDLNGTELNGGVLGQWQEKRFQTGSMDTMTKASKRRMQEAPTLLVMETQAAQLRRVKNGNPRLFNGQTKWIKVECLNGRGHDDSVSSRIQIGTYISSHTQIYGWLTWQGPSDTTWNDATFLQLCHSEFSSRFLARSVCSGWAWPEILKASAKMSLMKRGGSSCQVWSETLTISDNHYKHSPFNCMLHTWQLQVISCSSPVPCQVFAGPSPPDFDHLSFDYYKVSKRVHDIRDRKIYEDLSFAMIWHSALVEKYAAQESLSEPTKTLRITTVRGGHCTHFSQIKEIGL